jgi:hypothetical protein
MSGEEQDQAVVARRPLLPRNNDLGFRVVANRHNRHCLDALTDDFGIADEVVTGVAGHDAIAFGVRAERQAPTVQQNVIRAQVELVVLPLAALPYHSHAPTASFVADRLWLNDAPHFHFVAVRHRQTLVDFEQRYPLSH